MDEAGGAEAFDADLSAFDGRDDVPNAEDFVLDRNVDISDALPEQVEWDAAADDFLSVDGMEISEAEAFDGDAAAFAGDDYVGRSHQPRRHHRRCERSAAILQERE